MNLGRYRNMQADVLQDCIQFVAHSVGQMTSLLSADPAAIAAEDPSSFGSMAATPVQHPCKHAAGMSHGQAAQGLQSSQGCGGRTSHDRTNTSLGTATAGASGPAAICEAGGRHSGQEASEGGGGLTTSHGTATASLDCAGDAAGTGSRLVNWDDVIRAANSSRFGVVVQEDTLLRSLLGEAP